MTATRWAKPPTCPVCATNTAVEPLPEPIMGRHLLCATCATVFAGTEAEWRMNRSRRDARQAAAARRRAEARRGAA